MGVDNDEDGQLDAFRYAPREVLVIMFSLYLAVIVTSNGIVVFVIVWSQKLRTTTNTYIMSICVASLLVGVFTCSSSLHELTFSDEIGTGSPAVCVTFVYFELSSITACVFSFVSIAVDRYRSVVDYKKPRFTLHQTYCILLGVWSFAIIYGSRSVVQFLLGETGEATNQQSNSITNSSDQNRTEMDIEEDERQICSNFLEDESDDFIFRVIDIVLLFLIPFVIMVILYSLIAVKLWAREVPTNNSLRDKRKTIRLLVIIVALFFVCWSPFHIFEVIHDALEERGIEMETDAFAGARVWSLILAISNSWLNPVIYGYMNSNFRAVLKDLLSKVTCFTLFRVPPNTINPATNTTRSGTSN